MTRPATLEEDAARLWKAVSTYRRATGSIRSGSGSSADFTDLANVYEMAAAADPRVNERVDALRLRALDAIDEAMQTTRMRFAMADGRIQRIVGAVMMRRVERKLESALHGREAQA